MICQFGGVISFCGPPDSELLKKEITENITKEKVLQLINEGKLPNPKEMNQDYYYCSVNGFGLIVDKMGNVYRFWKVYFRTD